MLKNNAASELDIVARLKHSYPPDRASASTMSMNFRRQDRKMNGPKLTRLIPIAAMASSGTASGDARAFNGSVI